VNDTLKLETAMCPPKEKGSPESRAACMSSEDGLEGELGFDLDHGKFFMTVRSVSKKRGPKNWLRR